MADKKVNINVYSQAGEKLSALKVNAEIFGIEPNLQTIYDAIRVYRNNARQATAKTKTRAEVSGGGKKPWRQKGTGRARTGSNRSPIWVGGGNVFGPKGTQSFKIQQNRKEYRLALKSALTLKVEKSLVIDGLNLDSGKTKDFISVLNNLKVTNKVLVVTHELSDGLVLATRNIASVKVVTSAEVNVHDLIWATNVFYTKESIKKIEEALN